MKIAIQGELGSFSHQATLELVPRARLVPCVLSAEVFHALHRGKVDAAVIPIENTLAGSVTEHYDLLLQHAAYIVREHSLRIVHNLITAPGASMSRLRRVISHPVALAQCQKFLSNHRSLRAEPFYDTAGSVKYIVDQRSDDTCAIAGVLAARQYGARIIRGGIEDNRQNFTRFFLVKRRRGKRIPSLPDSNKTSIAFALRNRPGTLFRALEGFAREGISLSRIESRPVPGKPWEYVFYVDVLCGRGLSARQALQHLQEQAHDLKILGVYPAGVRPS